MPSAGELLRCERLKRNRTLSEIARETCISARYLEAIEHDNPKILPGDFFHRSFIRQYASVLCLDEPKTREILDAVGPPVEIDPIPAFSLPQQIAEVEQAAKPLAQVPTRVAATLLFLVLIGCSGLYALWNRAQEAADPAMRQPDVPSSPASQRTGNHSAPVAQTDAGAMDINPAATGKTWYSLSSAGKTVYSGVLGRSESKPLPSPSMPVF